MKLKPPPLLSSGPKRLVRPQDVPGRLALVEGRSSPVTIRHMESGRDQLPQKRTTLMWAGTDWTEPGGGFRPGHTRRCATIGPLVECTQLPPFYSVTLEEILVGKIDASGAIWGRVTATSGIQYEDAGTDIESGRDAVLDIALDHCASWPNQDDVSSVEMVSVSPSARQMQQNFGVVNRVVVLAFRAAGGPLSHGRTIAVSAVETNLAQVLFRADLDAQSEQLDLTFARGAAADCVSYSEEAKRLRSLIGELPVLTARAHRGRLGALNSAFERAGIRTVEANPRLTVDVTAAGYDDPAHDIEAILAVAETRKRLESGWLSLRRSPSSSLIAAGYE